MRYLSTFTGIGGFELAFNQVFNNAYCVGWSEIDKYAIKTFVKNNPFLKNKNFGDIKTIAKGIDEESKIDIIFGGSPCQDLSVAKSNRQGLKGSKSGLLYDFIDIVNKAKPKYFLLENVHAMPKEARDEISSLLGVEPVMINSDIWTPQKRKRLYWFNWDSVAKPVGEAPRWPELVAWSKSTRYKDIETGKIFSSPNPDRESYIEERELRDGRANTLTTGFGCGAYSSKTFRDIDGELIPLHPDDCEELQGFPIGWTEGVSDTQRYKQIGNAVTVPVVRAIFEGLKYELQKNIHERLA